LRGLNPVAAGHDYVSYDEIGAVSAKQLHAFVTVTRNRNFETRKALLGQDLI
jgi:hypothetical protein